MKSQILSLLLLCFLICFSQIELSAQSKEKQKRIDAAYTYIYDSISTKINIAYVIKKPLEQHDSLFLPCDTTHSYDSFYNGLEIIKSPNLQHIIYSYNNYVFRYLDSSLSLEFLEYKKQHKPNNWKLNRFKNRQPQNNPISKDNPYFEMFEQDTKISMPVFNSDATKMILEAYHECGDLCCYGFLSLYEFQNGEWIEVKKLLETVC